MVSGITLGCSPGSATTTLPTATLTPAIKTAPTPFLSPTLEPPDTGWQILQPGLERRMIRLFNAQNEHIESLYIYRLEQNLFRLDVAYRESSLSVEDWQGETNALMVVNGGFYREENDKPIPNGLTILNGQAFGSSYDSFGGMLAIGDEWAEVRSLTQKPYDLGEPLWAGLQSFPLLIKPGGELGFPAELEDNIRARRTVVAQDNAGRILFLIAPRGHFTLYQLSLYLTSSDLDLDIALNLDGGPSSGILLAEPREVVPSQTLLPIVILVYPR
ncbi:MAG TPA: phosphodiester glycosidase family protein [Anaerolineales bacterium]|nr:phosphodiester glycosidase family protein [Anaerolineales bacterium]